MIKQVTMLIFINFLNFFFNFSPPCAGCFAGWSTAHKTISPSFSQFTIEEILQREIIISILQRGKRRAEIWKFHSVPVSVSETKLGESWRNEQSQLSYEK